MGKYDYLARSSGRFTDVRATDADAELFACVDVWPPGACDEFAMLAYEAARDAGLITLGKVKLHAATGAAYVHYKSVIPHAWTRDALREYKKRASVQVALDVSQYEKNNAGGAHEGL